METATTYLEKGGTGTGSKVIQGDKCSGKEGDKITVGTSCSSHKLRTPQILEIQTKKRYRLSDKQMTSDSLAARLVSWYAIHRAR